MKIVYSKDRQLIMPGCTHTFHILRPSNANGTRFESGVLHT